MDAGFWSVSRSHPTEPRSLPRNPQRRAIICLNAFPDGVIRIDQQSEVISEIAAEYECMEGSPIGWGFTGAK